MATDALVALYSTTLAASASSVTIAGIPTSGFADLQIVVTPKGSGGNGILTCQFNGDASSNYINQYVYGEGTAAGSANQTSAYVTCSLSSIGTTFNPLLNMSIFDYSATNKHKTILAKYGNNDVSGVMAVASRWVSTSAISALTFKFTGTDTFAIGSTFTIYGIVG